MKAGDKPDVMRRRRHLRESPPEYASLGGRVVPGKPTKSRGAQPDQRFTRRLLSVMRDPAGLLLKAVCGQLGAPNEHHLRKTLPAEAIALLRYSAVAFRHLLLLLDWQSFAAESGLPHSQATVQYVRSLRRRHVKTSRSTLFRHAREFVRSGLGALLPRWGGGRGRRIPAPDRALLETLFRGTSVLRNYRLLHEATSLPGRPASSATVGRYLREFSGQTAPNLRQRYGRKKR